LYGFETTTFKKDYYFFASQTDKWQKSHISHKLQSKDFLEKNIYNDLESRGAYYFWVWSQIGFEPTTLLN